MILAVILILVAVIAFAMYDHIKSQLPENWRLKDSPAQSSSGSNPNAGLFGTASGSAGENSARGAGLPPTSPDGWWVVTDGANTRAAREFRSHIQANGTVYDVPILYFSCYRHQLYGWLDTRLRATNSLHDPSRVAVRVEGEQQLWPRQKDQNIVSPDPKALLTQILGNSSITLSMAFDEAPQQTLTMTTEHSEKLRAATEGCAH